MALSWVSVNALTGAIIADLPNLRVEGALKRTIGRYETQTATLPLGAPHPAVANWLNDVGVDFGAPPPNWQNATREKAVFLVALDENESPLWGGMVTASEPNEGSDLPLSLATAEDYFNDRFVGDESFYTWPQNDIVEYLVLKYAATDGIPIRVVKLPGANPVRGRSYLDSEDKTLYAVLDELSNVDAGPEWTIGWEWVDQQKLGLVLYVGARIGAPAPEGLGPASWFSLPGNVQKVSLKRGYQRGEGANDVMAVSSGSADGRPQSPRQVAPNDKRPKIEYRWSPSTSITEIDTLTSHAQRALSGMKNGSRALSIVATRNETDPFQIGDDVGFDLRAPAWPDGITGTARAIGIEITETTITPVLDVTGIEGIY
jgi:hypothetical protein